METEGNLDRNVSSVKISAVEGESLALDGLESMSSNRFDELDSVSSIR